AVLLLSGSVFAFKDIGDVEGKEKIDALHKHKILSGINGKLFSPHAKVSYAMGVQMLVKGLDLNIDHIRFIKEPKASDYFSHVADKSWYAKAFIVAHLNGLPVPKDVKPNAKMSREEFVQYLMSAIAKKGDYAFTEMW